MTPQVSGNVSSQRMCGVGRAQPLGRICARARSSEGTAWPAAPPSTRARNLNTGPSEQAHIQCSVESASGARRRFGSETCRIGLLSSSVMGCHQYPASLHLPKPWRPVHQSAGGGSSYRQILGLPPFCTIGVFRKKYRSIFENVSSGSCVHYGATCCSR